MHFWQVSGRGQCLGAEITQSQKKDQNGNESQQSTARFVGRILCAQDSLTETRHNHKIILYIQYIDIPLIARAVFKLNAEVSQVIGH